MKHNPYIFISIFNIYTFILEYTPTKNTTKKILFINRFFTLLRFIQNDRGLWNGLFLSQSSQSIGEIISFLSSQRNIIDVLWSSQVFLFTLLENLFLYKKILGFSALRSEWQESMKRLIFITKFTKYWWNDCVFKFSKEHHRCSMKYTGFSIYTFKKIFLFIKRFFTMLRFIQNDRVMFCNYGL